MPASVLIVDDHADYRAAATALLEADGLDVVDAVGDAASGLRSAVALRPTCVLLDAELEDADAFAVAEALAARPDGPAVVLTAVRDWRDYAPLLGRSAARGLLDKAHVSGGALTALLAS
jgi:DNA-binding NarL/FixJ family response regulator